MLVRREFRGFLSSIFTVAIGVLMLTFALVLGDSVRAGMETSARSIVGEADVVVSGSAKSNHVVDETTVSEIEALGNAVQVRTSLRAVAHFANVRSGSTVFLHDVPQLSEKTTLVSGRLPQAPKEVAVSQSIFRSKGYSEGSVIELVNGDLEPAGSVTVVGVMSPGSDITTNTKEPLMFGLDPLIADINGSPGYSKVYVNSEDPALLENIADLPAVKSNELEVVSADAEVRRLARSTTHGADLIVSVMAALGILCVVVAGIIVTSVFHTFASRRRREFALLRCLGASKRTVFSIVLKEGLFVGVVGAVIGVLLGVGATKAFANVQVGFLGASTTFSVSITSVVIALFVGILSALVASLRPARVANSVPPVLMASKHAVVEVRNRASILKSLAAVFLLVVGTVVLMLASAAESLLLAIPGGLILCLAVILVMQPFVVAVGKLLSVITRRLGNIPFSLAVENMLRNIRRSANSALALSVGAALAAMATVGFASLSATTKDFLDRETPVDAVLVGNISEETARSFESIPGVQAANILPVVEVTLETPERPSQTTEIVGVSAEDQALLRTDTLDGPIGSDTLLLGKLFKVPNGAPSTITVGGREANLQVKSLEPRVAGALISREVFDQITDQPEHHMLWIRFQGEGLDPLAKEQVTQLAMNEKLEIVGQVAPKIEMNELVTTYSYIVFGIIILALFVALIGVATATELSVFERDQEIRLFRALGATKGTVVASFAMEALCVAGIGTTVGMILGVALGGVGAWTVLANEESPPILDFDGAQLILAFLGCVIFGVFSALSASYRAIRSRTL